MSAYVNGSTNPRDDVGLPINVAFASPRRSTDPDDDDWTGERSEVADRRESYRDVPPPSPANAWLQPPVIIAAVGLALTLGGSWYALGNRLTAVETTLGLQATQLTQLTTALASFAGVDAQLARLDGQLDSLNGRIDAQRQTLTAIEGALMQRASGDQDNRRRP